MVADSIEFVGTLQPTQTVDLRARVNGYLKQILFEDGSNVQAGAVLFVIEQEPYKISLDAARAAHQRASAAQLLAESQLRRMEPLVAQGAVTQEEFDIQKAQLATAKADVAAAEAAVHQAELNLSYTKIVAPVAGRIGRHLVDVGNLVQAEQTPLATIQTIDPIYAEFNLSENDWLRFMEMQRQHELPDPDRNRPTLYLALPNEEGFPHEGKLDFRDLQIDRATATALRRAIFPNPGWQLIPGMFVRIRAAIGSPKPKVLVEDRAIGTDQRGEYLLIVNDKNTVEYRTVKTGIHVGMLRVIEQGVTANDWVVINGLQRARPGAQVTPERSQMNDAPPTDKSKTQEKPNAAEAAADSKKAAESEKSSKKVEEKSPSAEKPKSETEPAPKDNAKVDEKAAPAKKNSPPTEEPKPNEKATK